MVTSKENSLSAQWENMVAVMQAGFEVFTPWPDGLGEYSSLVV